jgi:hypothetical protein
MVSDIMEDAMGGGVPSPVPAGWKSVHRGSFAGAGPSEDSNATISSGRPRRPFADTTPASNVIANVERIFQERNALSF